MLPLAHLIIAPGNLSYVAPNSLTISRPQYTPITTSFVNQSLQIRQNARSLSPAGGRSPGVTAPGPVHNSSAEGSSSNSCPQNSSHGPSDFGMVQATRKLQDQWMWGQDWEQLPAIDKGRRPGVLGLHGWQSVYDAKAVLQVPQDQYALHSQVKAAA